MLFAPSSVVFAPETEPLKTIEKSIVVNSIGNVKDFPF
nr:MAG TPA: hypothetical protein [Caudoviricetes sp.]